MKTRAVNKAIEDYLNNGNESEINVLLQETGGGAADVFRKATIRRLMNACSRRKQDYEGDFLTALRNYLLLFNCTISMNNLDANENTLEKYGLLREDGTVRAVFNLPEYIPYPSFVEDCFLRHDNAESAGHKERLLTSPDIYHLAGFSHYKTMSQKMAVNGALSTPPGYTTLVSLPTGGGKSLITQSLAYMEQGLTIVIVPTVSLAIDQVRVARNVIKGHDVTNEIFCYYNASPDKGKILKGLKNKTIRLLFISPEAIIENPLFVDAIKQANQELYLKNIVIDEAHIVIDWGGLFRVDYQCLAPWRGKLIEKNSMLRTFLLSATFTEDVIANLKDLFCSDNKWIEIRCDELRHEPRFICIKTHSNYEKETRAIEMVRKMPHPMIVYVSSPVEAERFRDRLIKTGFNHVKTFTGDTKSADRQKLIDDWTHDEFDTMVATSAFGVGVDKADVRTVMHLYVPETPNAYYQELGRGGRDGLPCLSIMCINQDRDLNDARVSKVLTTPKMSGRWLSMLNQSGQTRMGNVIYIDTSVKPFYNVENYKDTEGSGADVNWNIYVLLLLTRYRLLRIEEITKDIGSDKYYFAVTVMDDVLMKSQEDDDLNQLLEKVRVAETERIMEAFGNIKRAIIHSETMCWSEMFYSTYAKVSEYCGGCNDHDQVLNPDPTREILKKPIHEPSRYPTNDILHLTGGSRECLIYYTDEGMAYALDWLCERGLSMIVVADLQQWEKYDYLSKSKSNQNVLIIGTSDYRELASKGEWFYLSGTVAAIYSGDTEKDVRLFMTIKNHNMGNIEVFHFTRENIYFKSLGKNISELVEGLILPISRLR